MGAPTKYNPEVANKLFHQIATTSFSVKTICKKLELSYTTVRGWLATEGHPFVNLYARAKVLQVEHLAEELLDIADDSTNDLMTLTKGDIEVEVVNREVIERTRIRIDTRKFLMAKLNPKKYGDKMVLAGDGENPLVTQTVIFLPQKGSTEVLPQQLPGAAVLTQLPAPGAQPAWQEAEIIPDNDDSDLL